MKSKFSIAMSLAVVLAILITSMVVADEVTNTIDSSVDPALETRTIVAGTSTSVGFFIKNENTSQDGDPVNQCNVATGSLSVTVAFNVPAQVSASSSSLVFTDCQQTQSITFSSSTPGSYTISVASVTGGRSGGAWDTAPASFTLAVTPPAVQNQTIVVDTPAPATAVYGSTFNVAAHATSGLSVSISTAGACTGNGSDSASITMTSGTGTCNVYYNQAGNSSYNPAPQVTSNTTAQKANATIDVQGYTGTYDGAAHGATGSAMGVLGEDLSASLDLGASFTNVPGGTANWSFTGGDNYNNASGSVAIVINKADAGCSISGYTGTYDGSPHGASGSCTGGGTLNLGASFTNVPGGTAHWTFTGDSNHNDDEGDVNIVINKANATINVSGYTGTYDGAAHGATGTATGVLGEDLSTGLNLGASFTDVPGGTANWSFSGGTNYNNANGTAAIVINKATLTVTADNKSIVFGQPLPTFTFQYNGFVNAENASVIDTAPTCGVGSIPMFGNYPITCSGGSDNNYSFNYVNGTLTVQAWTLNGFYQPVDMNGVYNTVKGGSTVPLKFEVFAGSTELTDISVVMTFVQTRITCDTSATIDEIEVTTTGGTSLRYDTTGGQFIQNWQTPRAAGSCYRVTMTTDDGSSLVAFFRLK